MTTPDPLTVAVGGTTSSATRATDPLTVAVQLDAVERYRYALSLAVRHGYTDNPDAFASRLSGETRQEIEDDAREFAETINAIREANAPERVLAVDPAQGHGIPVTRRSFAERLGDLVFDHVK